MMEEKIKGKKDKKGKRKIAEEEKTGEDRKETERERRRRIEGEADLEAWIPKTKLGKLVKEKKIKDLDEVIENYKILESEIIDLLIKTETDLLNIGQSKGKFGGGKRRIWRQTQKKTKEGNIPTFSCMAIVGDKNGHIGLGYGKSQETLPAKTKAVRKAKLSIMKISRGCGSFDCSCNELHSVPFIVEGKSGSSRVILIPAPQGTGLVIGDECKKILRLAGIKDVYSKTFGQTRTTFNVAKACMAALKKTNIRSGK